MLGPQQMPPQGARALIGELLGGRRGGPEVSATLDESQADEAILEFVNEGAETAVGLEYVARDAAGRLLRHAVGDLAPGATLSSHLQFTPPQPFCCIWRCRDGKQRVRIWSYDGRRRRARPRQGDAAEASFRTMYR